MTPSARRPSMSLWRRARRGATGGVMTTLVAGAVAGAVLTACSTGDGTTLRPPTAPPPTSEVAEPVAPSDEGQPADTVTDTVTDTAADDGSGLAVFELFPPWAPGGDLNATFTCDGGGASPPLAWTPAPAGSVELVLVMTEITETGDSFDEIGVVHWLVAGIAPTLTSTPEGGLPPGAIPLTNAFGEIGWTPPCPPEGGRSTYRFTVYALDEPLGDVSGLGLDAVIDQIRFTSTATAVADTSFTRLG